MRDIAQPKNGTYSSSRLNTKASGCGISVTIENVSQVLWCLTSRTQALVWPVGRLLMPVTRFLIPRIAVPPLTATRSQPAHSQ